MIEMHLGGLGFDLKICTNRFIKIQKKKLSSIWIGMFEAAAIAMELQDFKPPR